MDINEAVLRGEAVNEPVFTHSVGGKNFYVFTLSAKRLSGVADRINIVTSEPDIKPGGFYEVAGSMRSRNLADDGGRHLILSVFAASVAALPPDDFVNENVILLCGSVCKAPVLRYTPLGRELCDLLVAVKRPYGRADFLPLIAWGRNAAEVSGYPVGAHIRCEGRIQSREYVKKIGEHESVRTAYEVSLSSVALCPEDPGTDQ